MNLPARPSPVAYSPALGEWIASRVAEGTTVAALHTAFPGSVPSPLTVALWRDTVPAFGRMMEAADRARAGVLADETIGIADGPRRAAKARNAIQARQWLAERLDRERFGSRVNVEHSGRATVEHIHRVPDAELHRIISEARQARDAEPLALPPVDGGGEPPL